MKPTYQDKKIRLYRGDCLKLRPILPRSAAVVSDPPYGVGNNCDYKRFSGGNIQSHGITRRGAKHKQIPNDEIPFDPAPWLDFPKIALCGYQFFANRLPLGSIIAWIKKDDKTFGTFLSDGELCWFNQGKGFYVFQHGWNGIVRDSEHGKQSLHPSQKPVALMKELINRLKLEKGSIVIDPYMGSGSTGVAAMELGMRFIGIELEADWFEIAKGRIILARQKQESSMGLE